MDVKYGNIDINFLMKGNPPSYDRNTLSFEELELITRERVAGVTNMYFENFPVIPFSWGLTTKM